MGASPLMLGFALDRILGDPARWHPVAGFGRMADRLEQALWAPSKARGAAYLAVLLAAVGLPVAGFNRLLRPRPRARRLWSAVVIWASLGGRSLGRAANDLAAAVADEDLRHARALAPALVGRDPEQLEEAGLVRAAVESVAENTSDAVVATLLWAALCGPAGAAGHRAVNTLDAMVGHRTARHREFGWAAARTDDLLNWPAARLTVLAVSANGWHPARIWAWATQAARPHPSPNAGLVEAAFAAALGVRLGGPTPYAEITETRPIFDAGPAPNTSDVARAVSLSDRVQLLALVAAAFAARTRQ